MSSNPLMAPILGESVRDPSRIVMGMQPLRSVVTLGQGIKEQQSLLGQRPQTPPQGCRAVGQSQSGAGASARTQGAITSLPQCGGSCGLHLAPNGHRANLFHTSKSPHGLRVPGSPGKLHLT